MYYCSTLFEKGNKSMAETPCFFVLKESALQLLADLGSLTDAAAQVIQLGAANITAAHGLDLLDEGE